MHKDTLLEVKDDRLLYERACDVLESFMRRVLIDIVISVFLGVKLNNEAMRETFLSTSSGVSQEKETMLRAYVYRTCRPSGELSFPPVIDLM